MNYRLGREVLSGCGSLLHAALVVGDSKGMLLEGPIEDDDDAVADCRRQHGYDLDRVSIRRPW